MPKKVAFGSIIIILALLLTLFITPYMEWRKEEEEVETATPLVFDEVYYNTYRGQGKQVIVYNWGEYISNGTDDMLNVNREFEELTGIKVVYLTFSTNEELYAKLKSGNSGYDVIIPSDYMVGRMTQENMLLPLEREQLPNATHIAPKFRNPDYDPGSIYSVPYTWGVTGIIYNKELLKDEDVVDSWSILWDENYKGEILMFSNPRDAFGVVEKKLGYSVNTTNSKELEDCLRELKLQKPLVQAYVMDEIFDKMIGGEATLAPYYAGDAVTMMEDNPALGFVIPKEGTNIFVDAMAIPATAPNPELAHMYINFLMEPEIAKANAEYIGYATPNAAAEKLLADEVTQNPVAYPPEEALEHTEYFLTLPRNTSLLLDEYWTELLSDDQTYSKMIVPVFLILAVCLMIAIHGYRFYNRRNKQYF